MSEINVIGKLDIKGMDIVRRVYDTDGISPTLNTCGGGYREVKILDLEKLRVRKLTPTEYGRLQAFPMQNWEQVVSDRQAYKQFGNAVTVNVVEAIADSLKSCLKTDEEPQNKEQEVLRPAESIRKTLAECTEKELLEELMRRQAAKA